MSIVKRVVVGAAGVAGGIVLLAGPAFADQCTNISKKNQAAGAQVVFGEGDEILYITNGLVNRVERGLVDPDTGEGYHGLIAFDEDGDGVADGSTWIGVGPDGNHLPDPAMSNGSPDHGVVSFCGPELCPEEPEE